MTKMKTKQTVPIASLKLNDGSHGLPKNPRFIRDERFKSLCQSIKDNPEYMPARPIVVDECNTILGGNMRWRACKELGMTEIPSDWVRQVKGWSTEKKRRFIILDNQSFGEFDFDALGNEWDIPELLAAGFTEEELGDIRVPDFQPTPAEEQARLDQKKPIKCPKCGHEFTT